MNRAHANPLRAGFTLLELLVTVSILAILMGLIVPVFSHMKQNARIAADKVTAKNLETAFRAYLDHYSTWPSSIGANEKNIEGDLYEMLRGDKGPYNQDGINFYEFSNTNTGDKAVDSFWDPNEPDNERVFRAQFDHDYDNTISHAGGDIQRPVIVWGVGPDGKNGTADDITSW